MKDILNLTQHTMTYDQEQAGVFEPSSDDKAKIQELLTFHNKPGSWDIDQRSHALADLAKSYGVKWAMIGDKDAPYLMPRLSKELKRRGITPLYAFNELQVVEDVGYDGTVTKKSVFMHAGFVTD
jgi:hypothetical protein